MFQQQYSSFEDMDISKLTIIKAHDNINNKLLILGMIVMLLGPISQLMTDITGLKTIGVFLLNNIITGLGPEGSIIIGLLLIFSSLIIRDRKITFSSDAGKITAKHFDDEELKKIRKLHEISRNKQ